ncbi:pyridoxamine 5'-phosphate oxidase family protein [Pedococcus sp. NPDC057267]|uniref:pyridoxamine 5'-phosphate oxidase family protein n=1 Tax=Pedococcus sp. NPDC057267 TaxID=3346077 RepID=UPI00363CECF1
MGAENLGETRFAEVRRLEPRRLVPIPEGEALALLASVEFGRLVFTEHALPAVRPLNHILEGGDIIIRTRLGSAAASTAIPPVLDVVTYQADRIDPSDRTGWSVVVTGRVSRVTNPDRLRRCDELLHPWVELPMDLTLAIAAEIVRGFRLVPAPTHPRRSD